MQTSTNSGSKSTKDVQDKAQETVSTVAKEGARAAEAQLSSQKERAASTLDAVAESLRGAGSNMQDQQPQIASLAEQAASRVEDVSGYVREHDVRDMVGQVESFARREPLIFMGGALALGFAVARFLKASSPSTQDRSGSTYERGLYARANGASDYAGSSYADADYPVTSGRI